MASDPAAPGARRVPGLGPAVALYRGLMVVLPPDLRRSHGEEIVQTFRDLYRSAYARKGLRGLFGIGLRALVQVVGVGLSERLAAATPPAGSRAEHQRIFVKEGELMQLWSQDIRFAVRTLFKSRLVSIVTIVSLALIVAGNTVIFSMVNALLIRPLAFDPEERSMLIWRTAHAQPFDRRPVSPADFNAYRTGNRTFEAMAGYTEEIRTLTDGDQPQEVKVARVTPAFFDALAVPLREGRRFSLAEAQTSSSSAVMLSHRFSQRRFGGDASAIGHALAIDQVPHTIIGVMAERFDFIEPGIDLWLPLLVEPGAIDRHTASVLMVGKRKPGVSPRQARDDLATIAQDLERRFPEANRGIGVLALGFREFMPGRDNRLLLELMQGAGIFLLLLACANVANLLLVRGQVRQRELALRSAVGASRARIVRQLLTESLMLSMVGGCLGAGLGLLGVDVLSKLLQADMPRVYVPVIDGTVLSFSLAISILAGLVFGTLPAVRATGGTLLAKLRGEGLEGAQGRLKRVLAVAQVALATVLLAGIGFMVVSFADIQGADSGFDQSRLLTFQLRLPEERFPERKAANALLTRILVATESMPGAADATFASALPRTYQNAVTDLAVPGRTVEADQPRPQATWLAVAPGYFATLGIPLLRGRAFAPADREGTSRVAVVDQTLADRHWPGANPLGERLTLRGVTWTIVGVAANVRQRRLGDLDPTNEVVYLPWAQESVRTARFLVRAQGDDPSLLAAGVRRAVLALDPHLPVGQLLPYDDVLAASYIAFRIFGRLLALLAAFALLLAAMGVYGVLAFAVSQRRREIGVRLALGASRQRVVRMVVREGAVLALLGAVIGMPVVLGVRQLLERLLAGMTAGWLTFVPGIVVGLFLVMLLASLIPARRASVLSPAEALRLE